MKAEKHVVCIHEELPSVDFSTVGTNFRHDLAYFQFCQKPEWRAFSFSKQLEMCAIIY